MPLTSDTNTHERGTTCPNCGAGPASMTPVWESEDEARLAELIDATPEPDGIACRNCESTYDVADLLGTDEDGDGDGEGDEGDDRE